MTIVESSQPLNAPEQLLKARPVDVATFEMDFSYRRVRSLALEVLKSSKREHSSTRRP